MQDILHSKAPLYCKNRKSPVTRGVNTYYCACARSIFFHPDFTVGFGITPNQPIRLAGYTAGRELHPAPKIKSGYSVILRQRMLGAEALRLPVGNYTLPRRHNLRPKI
jgi:hypothetical protein